MITKALLWVYNSPIKKLTRGIIKIMYEVIKNILLILIAFLAPYWFPITQKIFNNEGANGRELLILLLIFVLPIIILYFGEKDNKKTRIKEMKDAFVEAIAESGLATSNNMKNAFKEALEETGLAKKQNKN